MTSSLFRPGGFRDLKLSFDDLLELGGAATEKPISGKFYGWEDLSEVVLNKKIKSEFKTKCFCNIKGGTGKTTLATQFAMRASALGNKTLLLDIDPQAHSTQVLGFKMIDPLLTIGDVFDGDATLQEAIVEVTPFLSVIPANLNLSTIDKTLDKLSNREKRLSQLISPIKDKYDLIIIDTNPAPTTVNANAFLASDELCVVTSTDLLSVTGMRTLFEILMDFEQQFNFHPSIRIIPNQFDIRDGISRQSLEFLKKEYPEYLTKTVVRKNTDIKEAQKRAQAVWQFKRSSMGAQDLISLTNELLGGHHD